MELDGATGVTRRDASDDSLRYTLRNGIETLALHWGLLMLSVGLFGALVALNVVGMTPLLVGATITQLACAVIVSALVVAAVRLHHSYDQTDRWDGPSAAVPVVTLAAVTIETGEVLVAAREQASEVAHDSHGDLSELATSMDDTMGQVADVSRQYAVGSKQAAAAATELNTLAGDLRSSIAQFKTTEHHTKELVS